MNIVLIGYGKMGKTLEEIATQRGHHIASIINLPNQSRLDTIDADLVDIALEFSEPKAAYNNIYQCIWPCNP